MASSTINSTCKICENNPGKYVCPRCNVLYCSVNCYKSEPHSQCSEQFYRECVMEEMSLDERDPKSTNQMLEILSRMKDQDEGIEDVLDDNSELDSDDEMDVDLMERLANIDLDDTERVWESLSSDERQEFEAMVQSGDIVKVIPTLAPWWEYKNEKLVEDVEEKPVDYRSNCPKIKEDIPPLNMLTKTKPSELIVYNVINVLAAYAFTVRYFNGDHFSMPTEAGGCVVSLSTNLHSNQNFEDYETAVTAVELECTNKGIGGKESFQIIREDVDKILDGPEKDNSNFYMLCALSDIDRLFQQASTERKTKREIPKNGFMKKFYDGEDSTIRTKIEPKHAFKIRYYLSFVMHTDV